MAKRERNGNLSRRDFLKTGTTAAVSAASLAAVGAPAILRCQNLNSRINYGVIGTGSRGCYLMRVMAKQESVTVTWIRKT